MPTSLKPGERRDTTRARRDEGRRRDPTKPCRNRESREWTAYGKAIIDKTDFLLYTMNRCLTHEVSTHVNAKATESFFMSYKLRI